MNERNLPHGSKLLILFCLFVLLLPAARAEEAQTPLYEAYTRATFQLRGAPDEDADRLHKIESNRKLAVLEYGETWCRVAADDYAGWAKTEWLLRFVSLDPARADNLPCADMIGVATVKAPCYAAVVDYSGNAFSVGDVFAVERLADGAILFPMMRGTGAVQASAADFAPLAAYDSAQAGDLIAAFTTYYNAVTGGALASGRAHNIALGCERIDGMRLASGEKFSFNAVCAPYRKSNGYRIAPNVSEDGEGYGGGVCQVSTTLYNALLSLPVLITRAALHKLSGVPYAPVGFDSAVGSYADLAFVNTLPYAIRIAAMPQNGVVTVLIYRAE